MTQVRVSPADAKVIALVLLKKRCALHGRHLIAIYGHGSEESNLEALTHWAQTQGFRYEHNLGEVIDAAEEAFNATMAKFLDKVDDGPCVQVCLSQLPTYPLNPRETRNLALALKYLISSLAANQEFHACCRLIGSQGPLDFADALCRWIEKRGYEYRFYAGELTASIGADLFAELQSYFDA